MTAVEPTTDHAKPRREVLCGLVVALLAPGALVAACGDSNSSGSGGAPAGGSGGGSGGGAGSKLAALDDVPQGGGLVVSNPAGGKILLVRTSAQEVKAYNAACTHQGTTVNPPQGTTITCPNHGSQFDSTTGAVKRGPATSPLRAVSVKVDGTNIVLA